MKKFTTKLIASLLSLIVAAALTVMSSYAWLTLSAEPEVGGIEIRIGGTTTILLAPDIQQKNADGTVSHYPGKFSQNLNFSDFETYDYIQNLSSLAPVSTADGVHWVLADYYSAEDEKVQQGMAVVGQVKDITDLPLDTKLQYANLTQQEKSEKMKGCYAYLDFWVVSPAEGYDLRVSTGKEQTDTGSFLVTKMEPKQEGNDYVLAAGDETAAASVRVGFLVNQDWASYEDTQKYLGSDDYFDAYTYLMGQYQEPGEDASEFAAARNTFTIYEPNGDLHLDGSAHYQITSPLGVVDGEIAQINISDRLTVQLASRWKKAGDGENTLLEQKFITDTFYVQSGFSTGKELSQYFYEQCLQGFFSPYVDRGLFVENTEALYADADKDGCVEDRSIALHTVAGATEDVKITTLQKNVPQRIRMFVWLEGQDADCMNYKEDSGFVMMLELAGS